MNDSKTKWNLFMRMMVLHQWWSNSYWKYKRGSLVEVLKYVQGFGLGLERSVYPFEVKQIWNNKTQKWSGAARNQIDISGLQVLCTGLLLKLYVIW